MTEHTTWRIHETHKEETKAVKAALKAAGINARVGHGKGTAWAWLKINVGEGNGFLRPRVIKIAQAVTGRSGEHDGRINVYSQKEIDE